LEPGIDATAVDGPGVPLPVGSPTVFPAGRLVGAKGPSAATARDAPTGPLARAGGDGAGSLAAGALGAGAPTVGVGGGTGTGGGIGSGRVSVAASIVCGGGGGSMGFGSRRIFFGVAFGGVACSRTGSGGGASASVTSSIGSTGGFDA